MATSIFLAQAFGLYLTIVGLSMLIRRQIFMKMFADIVTHSAMIMLAALMALILGILLVLVHNIWMGGWQIVITILAWLTLIKGIAYLFWPQLLPRVAKNYQDKHNYYIATCVSLGLGLFLLYKGFL